MLRSNWQISSIRRFPFEIILIIVGVFLLSFSHLFVRFSEQEISPVTITFDRFFVSTAILTLWYFVQSLIKLPVAESSLQRPTREAIPLFIISSILGSLTAGLLALSLLYTSIANASTFCSCTPIFATLGGWLFLKQNFSGRFLLGMAIVICGSILISIEGFQESSLTWIGDLLALLSALTYAANYLVREKLRVDFSSETILYWYCLCSSLLLFPITLVMGNQFFPRTLPVWLAIVGLSLFCQIIAQMLMINSLKKFSSGYITLFQKLGPIISACLAWLFFGEVISLLNGLSIGAIISGIYLASTSQVAKSEKKAHETTA